MILPSWLPVAVLRDKFVHGDKLELAAGLEKFWVSCLAILLSVACADTAIVQKCVVIVLAYVAYTPCVVLCGTCCVLPGFQLVIADDTRVESAHLGILKQYSASPHQGKPRKSRYIATVGIVRTRLSTCWRQ